MIEKLAPFPVNLTPNPIELFITVSCLAVFVGGLATMLYGAIKYRRAEDVYE